MFDYFVSGFAITATNPCNDKSEECVNTSQMKNLTVILGSNNFNGKQPYAVYRYNGTAFTAVDPTIEAIPLGLKDKGTTTHWFTPKAFISTTFRHKQKELIGFNYGDKTINKLDLKNFVEHKIGNKYWDRFDNNRPIDSFSYHLIELKITETQRNILLITQQKVYQLIDDKRLEEVMVFITEISFFSLTYCLMLSIRGICLDVNRSQFLEDWAQKVHRRRRRGLPIDHQIHRL